MDRGPVLAVALQDGSARDPKFTNDHLNIDWLCSPLLTPEVRRIGVTVLAGYDKFH